jgi:hypothetical protein
MKNRFIIFYNRTPKELRLSDNPPKKGNATICGVCNRKLVLQLGLLEALLHNIGQHKPSRGTTSILNITGLLRHGDSVCQSPGGNYMLRYFCAAMLLLIACTCVKQADFTDADAGYVFSLGDLHSVNLSGFEPKKNDNGKPYFFSREQSKLNGTMYFYGEWGYMNNKKISLTSSFNMQSTVARAQKLYEVQLDSKTGKLVLDKEVYGVDQAVFASSEETATIVAIKGRLVYWVLVEGIPDVREENLRPNFIAKLQKVARDFSAE